jgi:isopentenyl phosphate kinase
MQQLTLIKLGGSVVTFKERALAANEDAISKIASALSKILPPLIVVHGGGSFGHYWSVRYDMHTRPADYDSLGVAIVHESMIKLNQIIVNNLIQKGLAAYCLQPSVFTNGSEPIQSRMLQIMAMAKKVLPVTFGDVVHINGRKFSILSGDALMTILAKSLRPTRVIFATNVDGLYTDMNSKRIVKEIRVGGRKKNLDTDTAISIADISLDDVTGGMKRKVTEAKNIASMGIEVIMINGLEPQRIIDAAEGKSVQGTIFRRGQ